MGSMGDTLSRRPTKERARCQKSRALSPPRALASLSLPLRSDQSGSGPHDDRCHRGPKDPQTPVLAFSFPFPPPFARRVFGVVRLPMVPFAAADLGIHPPSGVDRPFDPALYQYFPAPLRRSFLVFGPG